MEAAARQMTRIVQMPVPVALKTTNRITGRHMRIIARPGDKLPFVEGLQKADEENRIILSHAKLDYALTSITDPRWRLAPEAFPSYAGTMTGYEEPGKPLGEEITYIDPKGYAWIFPVPQEFRGQKDVILVAEHPFYSLEIRKDDTRIVRAAKIGLIEGFPAKEGWYMADLDYAIPVVGLDRSYQQAAVLYEIYGVPELDAKECPNPYARYLHRLEKRVGPIMRSVEDSHHVFLNEQFTRLGMIVEAR